MGQGSTENTSCRRTDQEDLVDHIDRRGLAFCRHALRHAATAPLRFCQRYRPHRKARFSGVSFSKKCTLSRFATMRTSLPTFALLRGSTRATYEVLPVNRYKNTSLPINSVTSTLASMLPG